MCKRKKHKKALWIGSCGGLEDAVDTAAAATGATVAPSLTAGSIT